MRGLFGEHSRRSRTISSVASRSRESMCSLCGALGRGPAWERAGELGASARWQLWREAAGTAREMTALLAPTSIRVTASADHGFIVSFPTGGAEMARSLAEIWHLLDRRRIAVPDLLDA